MKCLLVALPVFIAMLTGCGVDSPVHGISAGSQATGPGGAVHGGQQPVAGATVILMVPGTTGYGSAATVLATTTTRSDGSFTLPAYTCPANSGLVYLLGVGGNSGSGINAALAEAAVLGPCGALTPSTFIFVSEVTTVAAAYTLAPFASVAPGVTGIGAPLSNQQGLTNAFGAANNLASTTDGSARAPSAVSGLVLPQAEMNTLADILASCVNTSGSTAANAPCGMLFGNATPSGGQAPTDTFQAALNIAMNPGNNVTALFNLATPAAPFQPTLTTAPSDFAVGIQYTGGGINGSYGTQGVAIDGAGNAWVATGAGATNLGTTHQLTEISPSGVFVSGTTGYGSSFLQSPEGVAIDSTGNVYAVDMTANKVFKFASNGSAVAATTAGSLMAPLGIAVDTDNTQWVTNSASGNLTHITTLGTEAAGSPYATQSGGGDITLNTAGNWSADFQSGSNGFLTQYRNSSTPAVLSYSTTGNPVGVALDSSGYLWYGSNVSHGGYIGRLNASGVSNLTAIPFPSVLEPQEIAIDGLNRVFVNSYNTQTRNAPGALLEYSSTGSVLSPANGLSANGVLSAQPNGPEGMAVDGSGNLWTTGQQLDSSGVVQANAFVTEVVGIAAPVVTPIAVAASSGRLGTRP